MSRSTKTTDPVEFAKKHGLETDWTAHMTCPGCKGKRRVETELDGGYAVIRFTCDCGYDHDSALMVTVSDKAKDSWRPVFDALATKRGLQ